MTSQHPGMFQYSDFESDALRELGNVAFSHATNALSLLLGRRVDLGMPAVRVTTPAAMEHSMDESDEDMCLVTFRVLGDRRGLLALVLPESDARALGAMLDGDEEVPLALTDAMKAAIEEVANIMCGAALLAIHRFLRISLIHGTPSFHLRRVDAAGRSALHLNWESDLCILVETEFQVEDRIARGELVISLADLKFFLDALKAKVEGD